MAVDAVEVLVRTLLADEAISNLVSGRIYGGTIPAGASTPLLLVRNISRMPATIPATVWWDLLASIDVHSENPSESYQIACAVSDTVNAISGTLPEGVVQKCEASDIASIEDGAWTPTRFRNVVTVSFTARSI